jgi:uncharacterized protein YndB with AHSA1/START domain
MGRVAEAIDVRAPIADVFVAITDPRRSLEWNPNMVDVQDIVGYPVREGSTWRQTVMIAGRPMKMQCAIVRFHPPNEGVLRITGDQRGEVITLCRQGTGVTRVDQILEFAVPGGLAGGLIARMAEPMLRRELAASLARMRDILEREMGGQYGSGA